MISEGGFCGELAPDETRSFYIQPAKGLPAGGYNSYVEVYDDRGGVSAVMPVEFAVIDKDTVPAPEAEPKGGLYTGRVLVSMTDIEPEASIYYTTDGSVPTRNSTKYSGPVEITETTVLSAFAEKSGMKDSAVITEVYTIARETTATPKANPAAGDYTGSVTVELSCATDGAVIHYTTDGTKPAAASAVYEKPLTFGSTTTLKAMAVREGLDDSRVLTQKYSINKKEQPSQPSGNVIDLSDMRVVVTPSLAAKHLKKALTGDIGKLYSRNAALIIPVNGGPVVIDSAFDIRELALAGIETLTFDYGSISVEVPVSSLAAGQEFSIELIGGESGFKLICSDSTGAYDIVLELNSNPAENVHVQRLTDGVWQPAELKTKLSKSGDIYLLRIIGITAGEYKLAY